MAIESIPFGQDPAGRMVDATEVPSGLACQCICPSCKSPLVAKKGEIKRPHFAHQADQSHCTAALESSLHRMAKQIYGEMKLITLPGMVVSVSGMIAKGREHTIRGNVPLTRGDFRFQAVEVEKSYGAIRPDVVLHGSMDLMVEVLVTHAVDEHKAALIRTGNHACVEVDLGEINRLTDRAGLYRVLQGPTYYKWIHHPRAVQVYEWLNAQLTKDLARQKAELQQRLEAEARAKQFAADLKMKSKAERERRRIERDAEQAKLTRYRQRQLQQQSARAGKPFDELYVARPATSGFQSKRTMLAVQEAVLSKPDALLSTEGVEELCKDLRFQLHVPSDGARALILEYLGATTPEEGHERLRTGLVPLLSDITEAICTSCGGLQRVQVAWWLRRREFVSCIHCGELIEVGNLQ